MARALLVSDHELINDIFTLNLRAYVGVEVMVVSSLEAAITKLERVTDFELIITLSLIKGIDIAVELQKYPHPLIVLGEKGSIKQSEKVIILPGTFNIPSLVKSVALVLGVTAKEMAQKSVPDFYPIPIKLFKGIGVAPCDIYFQINKMGNEYTQMIAKGDGLGAKVGAYISRGVETLYVPAVDRLNFINEASAQVMKLLDGQTLAPEEAIEAVEQGFELVADSLTKEKVVNEAMVNISKACVESIKGVLKTMPKLRMLLASMMENKSRFIYLHTVMTTYVATHIIKRMSWGSDEHVDKVSFVLFFHDMFLIPIYNKYPDFKYEEDLIFNDQLTDKEKEAVLNHAQLAGGMVKHFPRCPMGADAIVAQHHGMGNGSGFAVEFRDDISPLAKVIIIAEEFVNLILKARDQGKDSPYNVPMMIETLREKFTRNTYKKIIDTLSDISI